MQNRYNISNYYRNKEMLTTHKKVLIEVKTNQRSNEKVEAGVNVIGKKLRHVVSELRFHAAVSRLAFLITGPLSERHCVPAVYHTVCQ